MFSFRSSRLEDSPVVCRLLETIEKVAQMKSPILLTGESGTGKEFVARAIHERSDLIGKPFRVVHCGTLPAALSTVESFEPLLDYFELSQDGTLFLDHVEILPETLQKKLFDLLDSEPKDVSQNPIIQARLIAAARRDLKEIVTKKIFREDFYSKINGIHIQLDPLRECKSDIPLWINYFIHQLNQIAGCSVQHPADDVLEALLAYDWPGNIRELENFLEKIVILKGKASIQLEDLPENMLQHGLSLLTSGAGATADSGFPKMLLPETGVDLKFIVTAFENHLVDQALARTAGNKNRASGLLSMNRTTLVEKLRKRGMITPLSERELLVD